MAATDSAQKAGLPVTEQSGLSRQQENGISDLNSIYGPLDKSNKELRLLSILPGLFNDILECEINTFSLLRPEEGKHGVPPAPCFEALSYEWGAENSPRKLVIVQGQEVRSELKVLLLWIDAVCVNQLDIEERNHQVGLMEMIYTKADNVRVWLGPEAEERRSAFDLLGTISREIGFTTRTEISSDFTSLSYFGSPSTVKENNFRWASLFNYRKVKRLLPEKHATKHDRREIVETNSFRRPVGDTVAKSLGEHNDCWRMLLHILERTYWTRIWIVQEFVLAQSITIHYGFNSVDWTIFQAALFQIMRFQVANYSRIGVFFDSNTIIVNSIKHSWGSKIANMRIRGKGNNSLVELFETCRYSRCCDSRDRVYALIGLANDVPKDAIAVDYTHSMVEVREVVLKFFRDRHKFTNSELRYAARWLGGGEGRGPY